MLNDLATIEGLLESTGGVRVRSAGVATWGHYEVVPIGVSSEHGSTLSRAPSVVVPRGAFPEIDEQQGISSVIDIAHVDGIDRSWSVRDIQPADEDGATIRLMLSKARADV